MREEMVRLAEGVSAVRVWEGPEKGCLLYTSRCV